MYSSKSVQLTTQLLIWEKPYHSGGLQAVSTALDGFITEVVLGSKGAELVSCETSTTTEESATSKGFLVTLPLLEASQEQQGSVQRPDREWCRCTTTTT